MTGFKLIFYKLYIFFLALWMGGGIYIALAESESWYDDPATYIDHISSYPVPGAADPMPTIMLCLSVISVLAMLIFLSYHGHGKRGAVVSFTGTLLILLWTYLYFIPTHAKIFDDSGAYSNDQIVSMSKMWIILNYIRLIIIVFIFFTGLVAFSKLRSSRQKV